MVTMYGIELDRVIVVLKEMLALAKQGRCVYCDWPICEDGVTGCTLGRCSYIPVQGSDEDRKIRERYKVMGL